MTRGKIRTRWTAALIAVFATLSVLMSAPAQASTYTSILAGCTTQDVDANRTYYHWFRVYGYQGSGWFSTRSAKVRTTGPDGYTSVTSVTYTGAQYRSSDYHVLDTYGPRSIDWTGPDHVFTYDLYDSSTQQALSHRFVIRLPYDPDQTCYAWIYT